jgi:IstB-like ATP binding protein
MPTIWVSLDFDFPPRSTVLTSNKGFEEWGAVFGDEVMAAALIDRLVHHCHIVTIRGNSYRMRQHTDGRKRLRHHSGKSGPPCRQTIYGQ